MEMDIQVAPVQSLLTDAINEFDELETVRNNLEAQVESLVEALEECADVATTVSRVGTETLTPDIAAIMVRCNNAAMGVKEAVSAYQRGDEEMVMNAQQAAASPPLKPLRDHPAHSVRAEE